MFLPKKTNNTIVSLITIINDKINVICYDSNDVVTSYLRSISQIYLGSLTLLNVPMEERDNLTDEKNIRKNIYS